MSEEIDLKELEDVTDEGAAVAVRALTAKDVTALRAILASVRDTMRELEVAKAEAAAMKTALRVAQQALDQE